MNLILHNGSLHPSAVQMYGEVGELLREKGILVQTVHGPLEGQFKNTDVLLSNAVIPMAVRRQMRTCGGVLLSRRESMTVVQQSGLDVMQWAVANDRTSVRGLFDKWQAARILLKRSFTYGGDGIEVFEPAHLESPEGKALEWDVERDIFCAEVNPHDGTVYKGELFNGELMISWLSEAQPLSKLMEGEVLQGVKGAYGERRLFEFPPEVVQQLRSLSKGLTAQGVGFVSLDLMKDVHGTYRTIEINLSMIATWWTVQFAEMKVRFAQAISDWLKD